MDKCNVFLYILYNNLKLAAMANTKLCFFLYSMASTAVHIIQQFETGSYGQYQIVFCIVWHQQQYILYNNLKLTAMVNTKYFFCIVWHQQQYILYNNLKLAAMANTKLFFCIVWHQQQYILYKNLKLAAMANTKFVLYSMTSTAVHIIQQFETGSYSQYQIFFFV